MNTQAIHIRLIFWYSSLVILVALAFGAYTYHGVEHRLYAEMTQTMDRRAHEIARNILTPSMQKPQAIARHIEEVYTPETNDRFIRIVSADNSVFYVSGAPNGGQFDPKTVPLDLAPGLNMVPLSEHALQLYVLPADIEGKRYLIELGAPTGPTEAALHGLVLTLLYGLPVVIIIVSVGGYLLMGRALKPVERIRATAESITFGNLSSRLPVAMTGDSVEHLSITLNQMLDRLENSYEQANRFSADASHELRTPLAIMRAELESLMQRPTLVAAEKEAIGIILNETERLSHITEHLFSMSRLDAGESSVHELIDLAEVTKTTAEQMALLAQEKEISLNVDAQKAIVSGNAWRLKQIIVNLLDNAIKYTGNGGAIFLRVGVQQHNAVLEVSDNGMGIPSVALPHVFERFYRADKVRSRSDGGAGLGLSIVRSIAQAHGGTVAVESTEGKGTLFRVTLPLTNGKENKS